MKGYVTAAGYMGYVDGHYVLFADESDYKEYLEEMQEAAWWQRKEADRSSLWNCDILPICDIVEVRAPIDR